MTSSASSSTRYVVILTLYINFSFYLGLADATCYFPDGSSDSGHHACSTGATSMCCADGFQCLSNGFCNDQRYNDFERVLRGACTDKNWGSGCPSVCTSNWPSGDEAVYNCGSNKFCCGGSNSCCTDSSVSKFDFGSPQVVAIAGVTTAQATIAKVAEKPETTAAQIQQTKAAQVQQTTAAQTHPTTTAQALQTQAQQKASDEDPQSSTISTGLSSKADVTEAASASSATTSANKSSTGSGSGPVKISHTTTDSTGATVTIVSYHSSATAGASIATFTVTNTSSSASSSTPKNRLPIAVGVGVGVGVLLSLTVIAVFCLLKRRKKRIDTGEIKLGQTTYYEIGDERKGAAVSDIAAARPADVKRGGGWNEMDHGRGSGVLVELEGFRGVELEGGLSDAKEMEGSAVADNRG